VAFPSDQDQPSVDTAIEAVIAEAQATVEAWNVLDVVKSEPIKNLRDAIVAAVDAAFQTVFNSGSRPGSYQGWR
jgi:hypothetical protein